MDHVAQSLSLAPLVCVFCVCVFFDQTHVAPLSVEGREKVNHRRGSYHFNDKSSALLGHSLCIIPKVGMINLSFFLPVINEIAVANYDNFSLLFITFWQGYHCDFISPG